MTRKDYRLIAEAIRKAQERFYQREEENPYALVDTIIDDLSDSLKQDNIRFDRVRFYKASKLH